MITGYTSIKNVIAKLYRDLGINTEINEVHVVEWVAETLQKIGSYYQYTPTNKCLELDESGKVLLPCDFYRLIDIHYGNIPLSWASKSASTDYSCQECKVCVGCTEYTFYISNNYLITNVTTDSTGVLVPKICIDYLAVPVDSEGYPLVPDDVYFIEACAKYVTYMLDYREWRKGNIPDKVLQKSEQDYLWYINSARGSANMPGVQQLENIKNVWVRLIPKQNEFNNSFRNLNKQERRYKH